MQFEVKKQKFWEVGFYKNGGWVTLLVCVDEAEAKESLEIIMGKNGKKARNYQK